MVGMDAYELPQTPRITNILFFLLNKNGFGATHQVKANVISQAPPLFPTKK
jgi:hypothetical protein